jgi:hypothetical protein
MFGIGEKLRAAATTGGLVAAAGALAVMGLVWITLAAFTALTEVVSPAIAMLIVGLALIAPLTVVLMQHRTPDKAKAEPVMDAPPSGEIAALAKLVSSAQTLSEKSPLASAALALGAAYVASRSAATSPIAIQIVAEVIDQWAKSKTASSPSASSERPPEAETDDPSI